MGAPESGMDGVEQTSAESLLSAFRTIKPAELQRHAGVLSYWLSIRGDKEFPPLHDLDPLEISDAGPSSVLLELIGGGQDAEIRHLGDALIDDITVQRIIDAPNPSLLHSIAKKLPIVAISRDFLAFEDSFGTAPAATRCWVTLLPLSSCGSWVDYVYAFVSLDRGSVKPAADARPPEVEETSPEPVTAEPVAAVDDAAELAPEEPVAPVDETAEPVVEESVVPDAETTEPVAGPEPEQEPEPEAQAEPVSAEEPAATGGPGFSGILEGLANLAGFYGQGVKVADPVVPMKLTDHPSSEPADAEPETAEPELAEPETAEPASEPVEAAAAEPEPAPADEPTAAEPAPAPVADAEPLVLDQPAPTTEGSLHDKLAEVRAKADEAHQAALRATAALHEGLSAAYDFALDAETSPEEYLRLVEAQGLKIQLRAPMAPVGKLAFDGLVDPATLGQCEKILAWALKEELPRGALLGKIGEAGGIAELAGQVAA